MTNKTRQAQTQQADQKQPLTNTQIPPLKNDGLGFDKTGAAWEKEQDSEYDSSRQP